MEYLSRVVEKVDVLIAGLIGSIIASWWHKGDLENWKGWAVFLMSGVACAFYLTGMVCKHLDITDAGNVAGVGFLLGAFGGSLMLAVYRAIKAADLWALIRSKFGGGTP